MKTQEEASPFKRYVALDIHKHYVMVGAIDETLSWVLRPRKVRVTELEKWGKQHLWPTDEVVLESTSNAWVVYDLLAPLVARMVVANPLKVRQITQAQVKTDKLDLEKLLILLKADLVPEVWVPPRHVRDLRALIAHRHRVQKHLAMAKNRVQSVLHRLQLSPPVGGPFGDEAAAWWEAQVFAGSLRLQIRQDLEMVALLRVQKEAVHAELTRMTNTAPWANQAVNLMQLPGMGCILTMTILGAIGDITRFPDAKHLVGYAGLGAGVHASGLMYKEKRITKAGRKELRWAPVEAARMAVRTDPYWKAMYEGYCVRMDKHKALVAVARHMLVVMWHVLTKAEAARTIPPEKLARKMLGWAAKLRLEDMEGLTRPQFAKYSLMRLGVGVDLTRLMNGKVVRRLPPAEEILRLRPELRGSK